MTPRTCDLRNLDAVVADARQLHERGYDRTGQWDLTQTCRHITQLLDVCVDGTDYRAPLMMRLMVRLLGVKNQMLRTRSLRPGLPAPQMFVFAPASGPEEEAQAVEALAKAAQRVEQHTGAYQPHPVFGHISREDWLDFHVIHAMHHLRALTAHQDASAGAARLA